jgi:hypothetical protein
MLRYIRDRGGGYPVLSAPLGVNGYEEGKKVDPCASLRGLRLELSPPLFTLLAAISHLRTLLNWVCYSFIINDLPRGVIDIERTAAYNVEWTRDRGINSLILCTINTFRRFTMLVRTKYGKVWITLEFTRKVKTEVQDWFRGYCRDWFWNAEVRRNPEAFGYNRPREIRGKAKAFKVSRVSFGKFEIMEVR